MIPALCLKKGQFKSSKNVVTRLMKKVHRGSCKRKISNLLVNANCLSNMRSFKILINEFLSVTSYAANCSVRTAKKNLLLTMDGHIPKSIWRVEKSAGLYCFCFVPRKGHGMIVINPHYYLFPQ